MKRIKIIWKYIRNNRIKEYEKIIKTAVRKNYNVISLRDFIENKYDTQKKILILRHDVDHFSKATRMMFQIESKYGATSSFYFRNLTFEPLLMKEIEKYGSESSLHFETIADYIKANKDQVKSKEDLDKLDYIDRCTELLYHNINRFRLLCDIPCLTIASHGEYENRMVSVPNNFLTEDTTIYPYLGIKLEAYNKDFIAKISSYISDRPLMSNNGYRYNNHPLVDLENEEPFILFLTHPEHWHLSFYKRIKAILYVFIKGVTETNSEFKRL